jgi:transposase
LYVAFELSAATWKLALTSGWGVEPWITTVRSGDLGGVQRVLARGRQRWGLGASAPVVSCYEAGRDGFWIHRALTALGLCNRVVDSASVEVSRRARRAKTDRLDARKLVTMLVRACSGEVGVWSEVRVPSAAVEAARHATRERTALVAERTRLTNQIRGWLATYGARVPRRTATWWTTVCDWAGQALPAEVQARVARAEARGAVLTAQIAGLEAAQRAAVAATPEASAARRLAQLRGVAGTGTAVLLAEGLVWRGFRNRREVGGLLGFTPQPYQSGTVQHDHGISRAGNGRLRALSVQLAWSWLRWQPSSALSRWYQQRFAPGGGRVRRIGIIALARKLLIALWRYAVHGVCPDGAILKA